MLKIRLRRMGSRHKPFYRVVVSDSHRVPRASALEEVGFYDPRKTPATLSMNVDRVDYWMSHGARPSSTVSKLVARARAETPPETQVAAETEAATEAEAAAETGDAETGDAETGDAAAKAGDAEATAEAAPQDSASEAESEEPAKAAEGEAAGENAEAESA